jgi:hypothetical protein
MLFKQVHLEGIRAGKIKLAFRKWKVAAVKSGSLVKTSVGLIQIVDITLLTADEITAADAKKAGFESREKLLAQLNAVTEGNIFRIKVRYHGEDPRIALREQVALTDDVFGVLSERLQRLDRYSKQGAWTCGLLKLIRDNPKLRAADLAVKTGREKEWLKLNVRKLKNIGLTISHDPGYTLSPLGEAFLRKLMEQGEHPG